MRALLEQGILKQNPNCREKFSIRRPSIKYVDHEWHSQFFIIIYTANPYVHLDIIRRLAKAGIKPEKSK